MATNNSANMNLPIPVVGEESGPQYATDIDNCLTIVDGHTHNPGSGVPITPSGLSITSDLTMIGNNLTNIGSLRLSPQVAPISGPSDIGCLYESGIDLYYNDGTGTSIRITQSGGVAGTPGSISNLTPPASASYVSANSTFVFQSDVNTSANLDLASLVLRNLTSGSFGLTLAPPSAMGSNTTITLPTLPGSTLPVSISSSGNMSAAQITLAQLVQAVQDALVPSGSTLPFGGTAAPSGYLMCDGTAVSRTTYSALYSAIGNAYGSGDGSTTFNLPDMRGQFMRGVDNGRGLDPEAASRSVSGGGGNSGDNVGSYESDQFRSHAHTFVGPVGAAASQTGSSGVTFSVQNTGSNGGTETRPVNLYFNFIIKT